MGENKSPKRSEAAKLNARGLSLRDHWKHEFPKMFKELKATGEETSYFLQMQERYEAKEKELESQELPPGGAQEILSQMYYPVDETPGRLDSPIMH